MFELFILVHTGTSEYKLVYLFCSPLPRHPAGQLESLKAADWLLPKGTLVQVATSLLCFSFLSLFAASGRHCSLGLAPIGCGSHRLRPPRVLWRQWAGLLPRQTLHVQDPLPGDFTLRLAPGD